MKPNDQDSEVRRIANEMVKEIYLRYTKTHTPRVLTLAASHALAVVLFNSVQQGSALNASKSISLTLQRNARIFDEDGFNGFVTALDREGNQ